MNYQFRELTNSDIPDALAIVGQHTSDHFISVSKKYIQEYMTAETGIALVAETSDESIIGYAIGVVYTEETPVKEFDIRHPTVIEYPEYPVLLLKQCYIDSDYQGVGIGTEFIVELINWGLREFSVNGVFVECWVKPATRSSDELFSSLPVFTEAYHSESYYSTYESESSKECKGCLQELRDCECSGSIYIADDVPLFLELMEGRG